MRTFNKYLISLFFITKALSANNNIVSYESLTPYDNRFLLEDGNLFSSLTENSFDMKSVSSQLKNDITNPRLLDISTDFDFEASEECMQFIKKEYSCIKLQHKDFDSFCNNFNKTACSTINESRNLEIASKCNINLESANDFILTFNKLIKAKQFFCLKGIKKKPKTDPNNSTETDDSTETEDSTETPIDIEDDNNDNNDEMEKDREVTEEGEKVKVGEKGKKQENVEVYCPITLTLQKGYLDLMKEVEEQDLKIKKNKRSPLISDVSSFIPSRSIDVQVVKKRLVEDLKKNCNYTVCREKVIEFINDISDEYSYFNVIYKYKINDETLKESILKILNSTECAGVLPRYIISGHIILTLFLVLFFLF